jgi:hypothetical protein
VPEPWSLSIKHVGRCKWPDWADGKPRSRGRDPVSAGKGRTESNFVWDVNSSCVRQHVKADCSGRCSSIADPHSCQLTERKWSEFLCGSWSVHWSWSFALTAQQVTGTKVVVWCSTPIYHAFCSQAAAWITDIPVSEVSRKFHIFRADISPRSSTLNSFLCWNNSVELGGRWCQAVKK